MTVNSSEVWGTAMAMELDKRQGMSPEDLFAENQRLKAIVAKLKAALEACEDYFDNRADADGDSEGFHPNKEMNLLTEVREALGKRY